MNKFTDQEVNFYPQIRIFELAFTIQVIVIDFSILPSKSLFTRFVAPHRLWLAAYRSICSSQDSLLISQNPQKNGRIRPKIDCTGTPSR
jgi:hypothetical protein